MKENTKKIARLSYVIIFCILSYSVIIGKGSPNYSIIGAPINNYFYESLTNHFFVNCLKSGWTDPENGNYRPLTDKPECSLSGQESIIVENMLIFPNTVMTSAQSKAFKKFNQDIKRGWYYQYSNDQQTAYAKANKLTPKIMWVLFFLSLPIAWFTRNFSILIVTLITKGTLKGWKKL
tara:strand:+ start:3013 stop:3546 length:534 start_codon:yes stop_codon:yes gene_type:complete